MLKTLTRFTINNRFAGLPQPLNDRPEVIPEKHWSVISEAGGFVWSVGSQTIPGAAHDKSDHDFLVLSKDRMPDVFSGLGYRLLTGGNHYEPSEGWFNSWLLGGVNFVATDSIEFAQRFLAANETAKRLRLLKRDDRVALFQAVLYSRVVEVEA